MFTRIKIVLWLLLKLTQPHTKRLQFFDSLPPSPLTCCHSDHQPAMYDMLSSHPCRFRISSTTIVETCHKLNYQFNSTMALVILNLSLPPFKKNPLGCSHNFSWNKCIGSPSSDEYVSIATSREVTACSVKVGILPRGFHTWSSMYQLLCITSGSGYVNVHSFKSFDVAKWKYWNGFNLSVLFALVTVFCRRSYWPFIDTSYFNTSLKACFTTPSSSPFFVVLSLPKSAEDII